MDNYQNKNVLILGLGLNQGGVGSARFFAKQGTKVKVTDLKTKTDLKPSLDQLKEFPNIEYVLGEHRYEDIDWADLIIKNPALKLDNPYLQYALKQGKEVEMDMGIFLKYVNPSQIIGVTGTKGKSTTVSLIYEILKKEKKKVVLAGNIRKSVLDILPKIDSDTLVVLELSSFQLEAFQKHQVSPHIAVITNIFPDHLNYYGSIEKYIEAKRIIAEFQTDSDFLFLPTQIPDGLSLQGLKGQVKYFQAQDLPSNFKPNLPGVHNLENMAAALSVTKILGIPENKALEVMKNFKGVEYRLQLVFDQNGIKIYNDSASTNPESTIQALKSLPNSILICGGVNKDLDYNELAQAIIKYSKTVYFLEGDATEILKSSILNHKSKNMRIYNNFEDILKDIKKDIQSETIILFSPGAASFNLFQNEFDRGEKFNQAVIKVFGKI